MSPTEPSAPRAPGLQRLESWMFDLVSCPAGLSVGLAEIGLPAGADDLGEVLTRSHTLSARERLEIYSNAYFWRLRDILGEDFEEVREWLGPELWEKVSRAYLHDCPSRSWDLNRLGARLPGWLAGAGAASLPERPVVAELAALDWSIAEVFIERDSPTLDPEELKSLPQERLAEARFEVIPALRLHAFEWPINRLYQALNERVAGDDDSASGDDEDPGAWRLPAAPVPLVPEATWLAVFRSDFKVWRLELDLARYVLLDALREGATLGEALQRTAETPGVEIAEVAAKLHGWFQEWSADGLFAGVSLEPETGASGDGHRDAEAADA